MIWSWEIIIYLFLGGLGGGLFAVIAALETYGETKPYKKTIAWGAGLSWIFIITGLGLLILDLGRPERGIYTIISPNLTSPMSWGVFVLLIFTISVVAYWLAHTGFIIKKLLPSVWRFLDRFRDVLAIVGGTFGIMTGIYTGILLSYARYPLWNNAMLPILFLVSALATGAALFLFLAKCTNELDHTNLGKTMPPIIAALGAFELAIVIAYVQFLPSPVKAQLLTFGNSNGSLFLLVFLIGGVLIGEIGLSLAKMKKPHDAMIYLAGLLTIVGGFTLRYVVVILGPM